MRPGLTIKPTKLKLGLGSAKSQAAAAQASAANARLKVNFNNSVAHMQQSGVGWDRELDSEQEDQQPLPLEEHFVLRVPPEVIKEHDLARRVRDRKVGGANNDIFFRFRDSRRAVVGIGTKLYAARLVDLPTVTESHRLTSRSNDNNAGGKEGKQKGGSMVKVADISQALLVEDEIKDERDVAALNKPFDIDDFVYPHGLTPPMRHVRKRRFRKRVNKRTIEAIEKAVERLLQEDTRAEEVKYELISAEDADIEQGIQDAPTSLKFRVPASRGENALGDAPTPPPPPHLFTGGAGRRDLGSEDEEGDEDGPMTRRMIGGSEMDEDEGPEPADDDEDAEDEDDFDLDLANEINRGLEAMSDSDSDDDDDDNDTADEDGEKAKKKRKKAKKAAAAAANGAGDGGAADEDDDDDDDGKGLFGDDSDEDDDDDEEEEDDDDYEVIEIRRKLKLLDEETANLDKAISAKEAELGRATNPIFKVRCLACCSCALLRAGAHLPSSHRNASWTRSGSSKPTATSSATCMLQPLATSSARRRTSRRNKQPQMPARRKSDRRLPAAPVLRKLASRDRPYKQLLALRSPRKARHRTLRHQA